MDGVADNPPFALVCVRDSLYSSEHRHIGVADELGLGRETLVWLNPERGIVILEAECVETTADDRSVNVYSRCQLE